MFCVSLRDVLNPGYARVLTTDWQRTWTPPQFFGLEPNVCFCVSLRDVFNPGYARVLTTGLQRTWTPRDIFDRKILARLFFVLKLKSR